MTCIDMFKYNVFSKSYEPPKLQDYRMCLNLGKWFWGISLKFRLNIIPMTF